MFHQEERHSFQPGMSLSHFFAGCSRRNSRQKTKPWNKLFWEVCVYDGLSAACRFSPALLCSLLVTFQKMCWWHPCSCFPYWVRWWQRGLHIEQWEVNRVMFSRLSLAPWLFLLLTWWSQRILQSRGSRHSENLRHAAVSEYGSCDRCIHKKVCNGADNLLLGHFLRCFLCRRPKLRRGAGSILHVCLYHPQQETGIPETPLTLAAHALVGW